MAKSGSLTKLLESIHDDIYNQLEIARSSLHHPVEKGDGSENVWLGLFKKYLPMRYRAERAFVVDCKGEFSEQLDIVIFDRQYSPLIFNFKGDFYIPSESVYAVFEAKQAINKKQIEYAQKKVGSVRKLYRTSLEIPHAGGMYKAKPLIQIYGGILTFESDWTPPMGKSLERTLSAGVQTGSSGYLDIGCIAAHGYFNFKSDSKSYEFFRGGKPATEFLFKLISQLQSSGTVQMLDILAYSSWLTKSGS